MVTEALKPFAVGPKVTVAATEGGAGLQKPRSAGKLSKVVWEGRRKVHIYYMCMFLLDFNGWFYVSILFVFVLMDGRNSDNILNFEVLS